jgi:hypothetical protein
MDGQEARRQQAIGVAIALSLLFCGLGIGGSGCSTREETSQSSASPTPIPSPTPFSTPTPNSPNLKGTLTGLNLTLFDTKGLKVAEVQAGTAGIDPTNKARIASASRGVATLYREGKPAAKLSADRVEANEKEQTIQASGNVLVQGFDPNGTPTVRADTVVWQYRADQIRGSGNVRVRLEPDWEIPAESFTANSRLQTLRIIGGKQPAVGRL